MLAFVVLLPLVAIMGLSLPASVREFLEPDSISRADLATKQPHDDHAHETQRPRDAKGGTPEAREPHAEDPADPNPRRPVALAGPNSLPASDPSPVDPNPAPWRSGPGELPPDQPTQPLRGEENHNPAYPSTGVDPLVRTASAEESPGVRPEGIAPGAAPAPRRADPQMGEFQEIQQRLQDLGATYYRLETWAGRSQFRFHCRMAVRDNSHYSRNFEATDADPMVAMRRVLEQVERWRSGAPGRP
jgi:hypothetical protein